MADSDSECWVFISHVHEDEAAALWLKEQIKTDFRGNVNVYVSPEAPPGVDWFDFLRDHIQKSRCLVVLCSDVSVLRPWVHFEVGAAWALKQAIIPACYDTMTPDRLPDPFNDFQAATLGDQPGLERLYAGVANSAKLDDDQWGFSADVTQIPSPQAIDGRPDSAAAASADPNGDIRRRLHESLTRSFPWRTISRLTTEAGLDDEEIVRTIMRADDEVRFSRSKTDKLMAGLKSRVGP